MIRRGADVHGKKRRSSPSKRLVVRACEHSGFVHPSVRQQHKQGKRKKAKNKYTPRCSMPRDFSFIPSSSCSSLTFPHQSFYSLTHTHLIFRLHLYIPSPPPLPPSLQPSALRRRSLFSAGRASPRFFGPCLPSLLRIIFSLFVISFLLSRFPLNESLIAKPVFLPSLSILYTFSYFSFLRQTPLPCSHQSDASPFRTSLQHTPQLRATLLSNMPYGYTQGTQIRTCDAAQYTR